VLSIYYSYCYCIWNEHFKAFESQDILIEKKRKARWKVGHTLQIYCTVHSFICLVWRVFSCHEYLKLFENQFCPSPKNGSWDAVGALLCLGTSQLLCFSVFSYGPTIGMVDNETKVYKLNRTEKERLKANASFRLRWNTVTEGFHPYEAACSSPFFRVHLI
jgi:hypothetical protein